MAEHGSGGRSQSTNEPSHREFNGLFCFWKTITNLFWGRDIKSLETPSAKIGFKGYMVSNNIIHNIKRLAFGGFLACSGIIVLSKLFTLLCLIGIISKTEEQTIADIYFLHPRSLYEFY